MLKNLIKRKGKHTKRSKTRKNCNTGYYLSVDVTPLSSITARICSVARLKFYCVTLLTLLCSAVRSVELFQGVKSEKCRKTILCSVECGIYPCMRFQFCFPSIISTLKKIERVGSNRVTDRTYACFYYATSLK